MSERSVYLRDQADKCRRHANNLSDIPMQDELRKLAADFIERATSIESVEIRVAGKPKPLIPRRPPRPVHPWRS